MNSGYIYLRLKRWLYSRLSDKNFMGFPIINQPTIIKIKNGSKLEFGEKVKIGYAHSPFYYSGSSQLRLDDALSVLRIGPRTIINNNASIFCGDASLIIGADCLIGPNFYCSNSDGHMIEPDKRRIRPKAETISIGNNVFIGANVIILKGVVLGNHSVVAAGSVVTKSFPEYSVIAGNPAKLVKTL